VSKLKGDTCKYKSNIIKVIWLRTYRAVASNHHLRIEKKKLLGSLVNKAKKAYEAKQAKVCEKGKLQGESEQIPQEHVILVLANRCSCGLPSRPPRCLPHLKCLGLV
jgi:nucleolar protein 58